MQRLVFNPKAYAFVNTTAHGVVDVSDYIVRGMVNRRINAVSTASLTLQNPNSIFTKNGGVRLTPMDPITIYLQRKTGYPVRTFTGFLDTGTYYQLLPGPIEITASCTLKRLQNVYFDPALQYTQEFFRTYGWLQDTDGTIYSTSAQDATGEVGVSGGTGFQGAAATAQAISAKNYPYTWGGGHAKAGTPDNGTGRDPGPGFDCSGYVAAILAGAGWGFKKGQPVGGSGSFKNWGVPGKGKKLTVWSNDGHVFIEFMNGGGPGGANYADTSTQAGGERGPHLRMGTRSTDGFTPTHWEGN